MRRRHRRPPERNLLLFLVALALLISLIVWRVSPPPLVRQGPTATPPPAAARAPSFAPLATARAKVTPAAQHPNALERSLSPALNSLIEAYAAQGITHVGLVIEDESTGDTLARNGDDPFTAASLYKLFVLWRTQVEIRSGRMADDSTITLTAKNDDSAEDGYMIGSYGEAIAVSDLRRLMIEASNNTAAQMLGQWFGLGTINQLLRAHDFTMTDVVGEPETTPLEVTRFFAGVLHRTLDTRLTNEDYDLMLTLLKEQQVNTKLSTGFPDGTVFAHKTGDITGSHHDAGIVYLPDGRAVCITVMTEGDYDASVRFDHDIADLLWRYLVPAS